MVLKKISCIFLIISILGFLSLEIIQKKHILEIEKKIRILKLKPPNLVDYNYLEIPSINLKQIIISGITEENLDKNYITTNDKITKNNNITLAGHSIRSVFGKLHKIKLKDKIYINNIYEYEVIKKEIIIDSETYKLSKNKDNINLLTCTLNNKKRLLVIAKLVD